MSLLNLKKVFLDSFNSTNGLQIASAIVLCSYIIPESHAALFNILETGYYVTSMVTGTESNNKIVIHGVDKSFSIVQKYASIKINEKHRNTRLIDLGV